MDNGQTIYQSNKFVVHLDYKNNILIVVIGIRLMWLYERSVELTFHLALEK